MSARVLLRSFAGGEVTPELYGRIDLSKFQAGLAKALNFRVLPHGPAQRRPGFRFINQARGSTVRLIPFSFSADQTVVLEFGPQYVRFHVAGATLLEANKTITSIVGNTLNITAHGYSAGDWLFVGGRFLIVATVPTVDSVTVTGLRGEAVTPTGTTAARVYQVATPYAAGDLFALRYAQSADVLTLTHPSYPAKELRRLGATNWTLTDVAFAPPPAPASAPSAVPTVPTSGTASTQTYAFTYIAADGSESLASPTATASNPLNLAGNFNTVSWTSVPGAGRYNVYKLRGGVLAYIGSTTGTSIVDDNITPDTTKAPPEGVYTLNTGAGDYPAAVTYYEQRRWFAGTTNEPQKVWATRSGTEANLTSSLPSQDDDALEFRIAARQQNAIRHLVPLSDMLALTVGGEFRIFSDNGPAITPTALSIKPQGYSGASEVTPVVTSGSVLYVQAQGARLREAAYNWQQNAFASIDITIMAPHLFNGYTLLDMAYTRAPVPELWAVRNDGTLLCMTYVPEQQVYGWSQHTTSGVFESVAVVSEGSEDVLYAVARRTVGGQTVRYIERLQSRIFVDQADAFFVDSGLTYRGAPVTSVSGLWHLEGCTVQILADGAVHPPRVVTGGAVTLTDAASVVHVGLGYESDLQTLPLAMEGAPAGGQGMLKNVDSVRLRVTQSTAVKAGPSFSRLAEYPNRDVSDDYDSPPALRTGELRFQVPASWNPDASLCVRQDLPLPLTVLSMTLDVAGGG